MSAQTNSSLNNGYAQIDPATFEVHYSTYGSFASVGEFVTSLDASNGHLLCLKSTKGYLLRQGARSKKPFNIYLNLDDADERDLRTAVSTFNAFATWVEGKEKTDILGRFEKVKVEHDWNKNRVSVIEDIKRLLSLSERIARKKENPDKPLKEPFQEKAERVDDTSSQARSKSEDSEEQVSATV